MALVDSFDSIIFDYGGVLVKHQTEADQAGMAALLNAPAERFTKLYWEHRAEYDRGDLTADSYWGAIAHGSDTLLNAQLLDQLVSADATSWMQFDEVIWKWLRQLHGAGKRLAVLSNMPQELGEALKLERGRLELFDQVTLSYEVRAAKPELEIYEVCLEGLGAVAERTLFFDDRVENIEAAELLGIRAIQFLDRDAVLLQVT